MSNVFTFRIDPKQRRKLKRKAFALGMSESEFVRHLIDHELSLEPLRERLAGVRGCIALDSSSDDAVASELRRNNWRD